MNESKMHSMPINVASKCKNKNPKKNRLYLSLVYIKNETKRTRRKIRLMVFKTILAIIPTWIVSLWAISKAYAYRGYKSIGGEWLLIMLVFGFSFNFISNYIDKKRRKEKRRREGIKYYY